MINHLLIPLKKESLERHLLSMGLIVFFACFRRSFMLIVLFIEVPLYQSIFYFSPTFYPNLSGSRIQVNIKSNNYSLIGLTHAFNSLTVLPSKSILSIYSPGIVWYVHLEFLRTSLINIFLSSLLRQSFPILSLILLYPHMSSPLVLI